MEVGLTSPSGEGNAPLIFRNARDGTEHPKAVSHE